MIFIETPANPTNDLIDIAMFRSIADVLSNEDRKVLVAVDNTYLGPLWQHPIKLGADLVIYSATKYIGGHSDVIAGAALGSKELIKRIKDLRSLLGNMAGPWTGWLLLRSLETLKPRMELQAANALQIANFLKYHPRVKEVHHLSLVEDDRPEQKEIYERQCLSPGAMVSFEIEGGEKEAFAFLNSLKLVKLAVSLGSTESLAQHPATMTHAGLTNEEKQRFGVKDNLVRISIGIEHADDLIWDINQALDSGTPVSQKNKEHADRQEG